MATAFPLVTGEHVAAALGVPVATPAMETAALVADQWLRPYLASTAFPDGIESPSVAPVHEAALAVAIDVLQSRNAAGGQSVGFEVTGGPYRMGSALWGKVAGLVAPWAAQGSEVG
jgi:hypothetical protein